jgi:hypothetical protein
VIEIVRIHKWPFFPIPAFWSKFFPRNISHMPVVTFLERLDLDPIFLFPDGHEMGEFPAAFEKRFK